MEKALVLIDFQKEWTLTDSEYYVGDVSKVIKKVNRLIDYCREKDWKIVFTKHIEKISDKEFSEETDRIELIEGINNSDDDIVIDKYKISPFFETDLDEELDRVDEVIVCGILTNLCVRSFIQDAYDRSFDITVIKDCCVAMDEETQEFTFKDLKETREEIEFVDVEEFFGKS